MKKILKYTSLFIIAIAFTFGFGLNAKADACGDLDSDQCRIGTRGVIKTAGGAHRGYPYRRLTTATKNVRTNRTATGEYSSGGSPLNRYKTIGVDSSWNSRAGFNSYDDGISAVYCMDAQLNGNATVYAERFLFDSKDSDRIRTYDAAVMTVLLEDGIVGSVNSGDIKKYFAKNLAIRALNITYNYLRMPTKGSIHEAFYASKMVAYNWYGYFSAEIGELNAALSVAGLETVKRPAKPNDKYNFVGDAVNLAASYYKKGLQAATEYAKNLKSKPKAENVNPTAGETETVETDGNVLVQKDVVHTIKLSNFSNKNKFVLNSANNGIKFAEGMQYEGLTAYIKSARVTMGTVFTDLSKEQVAASFDKDWVELKHINIDENPQDVTIEFTVHLEGYKSSTDPNVKTLKCGQAGIKYSIDGTYNSDSINPFEDYVATIWYTEAGQEKQRYIGVEKVAEKRDSKSGTPWSSPFETSLTEACDCEDLEEACKATGDPSSDECTELKQSNCGLCTWLETSCEMGNEEDCEKFAVECDLKCDAYFDTFECCDEKDELIVSPNDDHEVKILGPGKDNPDAPSVKACFVTAVDSMARISEDSEVKNNAGVEGVKDQKDNLYTLSSMKDNSYCTVSCKEDYIMTMPTAKLVNAGRYFTFKAKVEGSKVCYTNTIDRDKYNKDIIQAQKDLVDAYNNYRKWYQLYSEENYSEPENDSYVASCGACGGGCNCGSNGSSESYAAEWRADGTVKEWFEYDEGNINTGTIKITSKEQSVFDESYLDYEQKLEGTKECNGTCTCTSKDCDTCCNGDDCHDCRCTTTTTKIDQSDCSWYSVKQVNNEASFRSWLSGQVASARSNLEKKQQTYRDILKEYADCSKKWKSEINYDPNVYYDYSEDDYMNMLSPRIGEMQKSENKSSAEEWYCNSNVSSGSGNETKATLTDENYEECSTGSSNGYRETSINYIYCDTSGCRISPERVSDARYKKITSKVNASYRPATLFYNVYPSGEITTEAGDNNVALERDDEDGKIGLLPVSLKRERGIYKYTVNMENIGEFYDVEPTDNLGRYVGTGTTAVIDDLDNGILHYNCSYLVNIQKTEGWVCDFDQDCTDDCIADCVGPNCEGDDDNCDGVDCVADCIGVGCIYDSNAGSSLLEKTISLNKMFPNGTSSYNWNENGNEKAKVTVADIEEKGNSVYDEEPILSITLTPSNSRDIKAYNSSVIDDGGYSNATVTCEAMGGFEEVACYSSFIDDLLAGVYGNKVVNSNSKIVDDSYRHSESSGYFELWPNGVSEDNMIGPAWK